MAGAQLEFGAKGDVAGHSSSSPDEVLAESLKRLPARYYVWASVIVDGRVVATDYAPDVGWLHPSSKEPPPVEDEVTPPIDSLEEALAAIGPTEPDLANYQASDTHIPGALAWIESEVRGDGWDITFVCSDSPGGDISHAAAKVHVRRDGTVDEICIWQDPSGDTGVPGNGPPDDEETAAPSC